MSKKKKKKSKKNKLVKRQATATNKINSDGELVSVVLKHGKKREELWVDQFADEDELSDKITDWMVERHVSDIVVHDQRMTAQEELEEMLWNQAIFVEIVQSIADCAEGITEWKEFDVDILDDIAYEATTHVNYIKFIFERIVEGFSPMAFCELANAEDRPEDFFEDMNNPVNAGLNKIKDIVFGNTREERMKVIDLKR
jgi:hypothetical protein